MKTFLTILLVLFASFSIAQFPITEEFDLIASWTYTNGAGIQNYGGTENWATFNIGNTPYPNNSTITITSPVYNLTNCTSGLEISFPMQGRIEPNFDYAYFEYRIGGGAWITVQTFTGIVAPWGSPVTYTYTTIPNTATQFRFRLVTDFSVNSYGPWWNSSVYYYDIQYFNINCAINLPVELQYFNATVQDGTVVLNWSTASELNNDYFTIDHSIDGKDWETIATVNGAGTTQETQIYQVYDMNPVPNVNYYRLTQTDIDGNEKVYDIIAINNQRGKCPNIVKRINIMGQDINEDQPGLHIIIYDDGTVKKIMK